MKRWICIFILVLVFLKYFLTNVFAGSSYVLPYPSSMPGSKFYIISLIKEKILKYWHFGNFGQFTYNLKQSDKYLVEAKTLFEYKQYFLGFQALKMSDKYFSNTLPYLVKAKKEGKNIVQKQNLLKEAITKHIEVLSLVKDQVPESFLWQPEKSLSTNLELKNLIEQSIAIRKKYL